MNNLKKLREMHKITQTEIAKKLKTHQVQYSRYERGERELRESQIIELCKYYKVSADWLLGIEGEENEH